MYHERENTAVFNNMSIRASNLMLKRTRDLRQARLCVARGLVISSVMTTGLPRFFMDLTVHRLVLRLLDYKLVHPSKSNSRHKRSPSL
jgi:hypothetical protein